MKLFYIHLNQSDFDFSDELKKSTCSSNLLPSYAEISIKQSRSLGYDVEVITDTKDYTKEVNQFYQLCKHNFPSFYNDSFWLLTLLRLYVVFLYAKNMSINNFVHMEYDNLVYYPPETLGYLQEGVYCTQVGPLRGSAGFMYVNGLDPLFNFINRLTQLLENGEERIRQHTGEDQIFEMIMLDLIHTNTKNLKYLPLFPDTPFFNRHVFDGASYGQFLGGTNGGNNKGWYGTHHYVGKAIYDNVISNIALVDKKPFVQYKKTWYPIFNLHIHSKNLKEFI